MDKIKKETKELVDKLDEILINHTNAEVLDAITVILKNIRPPMQRINNVLVVDDERIKIAQIIWATRILERYGYLIIKHKL